MSLTTNLVSYWKFDESSGNASDSVGGNTLTKTGSATYASAKINNGASFPNSAGNYFGVSGYPSNLRLSTFTFACWIRLDSTGHCFLCGSSAGNVPVLYVRDSDSKLQFDRQGYAGLATSTSVASRGVLIHIGLTYNNATGAYKFYLNGAGAGSGTISAQSFVWSGNFAVGNVSGGSQYHYGLIDEFGIWSSVLSDSDFSDLYNSGAGLQYPFLKASNAGFFKLIS